MTVSASPMLPATSSPSPGELWEPTTIFFHNWVSPLTETATWRTVVEAARSNAEQRMGQVDKPYRSQNASVRSYSGKDALKIQANAYRTGRARMPSLLYADQVTLIGRQSPLAFVYLGEFTDRRFYAGAWACAAQRSRTGVSDKFKFRKILSVSAGAITLDGDLLEQYVAPAPAAVASGSTGSAGTTLTSPAIYLSQDQALCCFVAWKGVGASTITDIRLRCVDSGYSVSVFASMFKDQASKAITGTNLRMGVVCGMPPQTNPSLFGSVVVEWTVSTSGNGPVHFHNVAISGAHRIVSALSNWKDTTAGTTPTNAIDVTSSIANSIMVSFHTACAASGIFASSSDSYLAGLNEAGLQTFSQYLISPGAVADTMTAAHNSAPATESLMALAVELSPVESSGLDREDIFPVIEAEIALQQASAGTTDTVLEGSLKAIETAGTSSLDGLAVPGTNPAWCPGSYSGHPVFPLAIDWKQLGMTKFRAGERNAQGISSVFELFGTRPGESFSLSLTYSNRQECMRLLQFFDSRGGRGFAFWLPAPAPVLVPVFAGGTSVQIPADIPDRDWELFGNLAIRQQNGTWSIHQIVSSVVVAGVRTLTLAQAVPGNSTDEYHIAHLVRFDSDEISYEWMTTTVLSATVPCFELLEEKSVAISVLNFVGPGGTCDPWAPDNAIDLCKCKNKLCGTDDPDGCCICGMDQLVFNSWCYLGPCYPTIGCANPCEQSNTCAGAIPFVSCVNGIARWQSGDFWVELDTINKIWSYDLGTLVSVWGCCAEVQEPGSLCLCSVYAGCIGLPDVVEEWDCTHYTKSQLCDKYMEFSGCTYVPLISFKVKDGGPGSIRCAGL